MLRQCMFCILLITSVLTQISAHGGPHTGSLTEQAEHVVSSPYHWLITLGFVAFAVVSLLLLRFRMRKREAEAQPVRIRD